MKLLDISLSYPYQETSYYVKFSEFDREFFQIALKELADNMHEISREPDRVGNLEFSVRELLEELLKWNKIVTHQSRKIGSIKYKIFHGRVIKDRIEKIKQKHLKN